MQGFTRFDQSLIKAQNRLTDLRAAYVRAGKIVLRAANKRVPVVSGTLKATGRSTKMGKVPPKRATKTVVVSYGKKKVPYANPIHWGWQKRNIKGQRWLTRAARRTEKKWLKQFRRDINRIVKQVRGR